MMGLDQLQRNFGKGGKEGRGYECLGYGVDVDSREGVKPENKEAYGSWGTGGIGEKGGE